MPRVPKKMRREDLPAGDCLCNHCTGKCCRYFSLPFKTPETWADYDEIRWYLAHDKTLVYVHKETWYLLVKTVCRYLLPDNRCGIYHDRPEVCREYTTDDCEYNEDWSFELCFEAPDQIFEYAEAVLKTPRPKPKVPRSELVTLSPKPNPKPKPRAKEASGV